MWVFLIKILAKLKFYLKTHIMNCLLNELLWNIKARLDEVWSYLGSWQGWDSMLFKVLPTQTILGLSSEKSKRFVLSSPQSLRSLVPATKDVL